MTHESNMFTILVTGAAALTGLGLGLAYFSAVRKCAQHFLLHRSWRALAGQTIIRMLAAVALLTAAARFGAPSLLAAFVGFLVARAVLLRRYRVSQVG